MITLFRALPPHARGIPPGAIVRFSLYAIAGNVQFR